MLSLPLVIWILLSLVLFWCVGLYNRVLRIRLRAEAALRSVEKHMHHCVNLVTEVHAHSLAQGDNWVKTVECSVSLGQVLKLTPASPFDSASIGRLGSSFDALKTQWDLICRLPSDLAGPQVPEPMQMQWEQHSLRVVVARSGLNQILQKYNEAIAQFPARLLAGMMRFSRSEQL